jgi:polysaccharide export outer membrane protein
MMQQDIRITERLTGLEAAYAPIRRGASIALPASDGIVASLSRTLRATLSLRRSTTRAAAAMIFSAAALCACAQSTQETLPPIPLVSSPQAGTPATLPAYRAQVGDLLDVRLFLNPELNEEVGVRPDGMISTTLAEDVPAANRTPAEISADLRERYKATLRDPRISVIVHSFAPNRIYVAGEVTNPGEFITVGPNLTVSQAIARAGGVKLSAQRNAVFVIRRGPDDKPQAFAVDYMNVIKGVSPQEDARLAQYDVVYVPRTGIYEVWTFWNQWVQQFMPVSWGFSYNINSAVSTGTGN